MAVPARDTLLVAGCEDAQSIDILRGFAPTIFESSGYPVTGRLLRWTGDAFEWFE